MDGYEYISELRISMCHMTLSAQGRSSINKDEIFCPIYQINQGLMHIFGHHSSWKLDVINYMKQMKSNGNHINLGVNYSCRKLRYIPIDQPGVSFDGEYFPNSIFEVEMIPNQIWLMGFPFEK